MTLFAKSENTQAHLKAGLMGFAGAGKTWTASSIAMGLIEYLRKHDPATAAKPAFFLDTETGADYVGHRFTENGIELFTAKTRAFSDLVPALEEAEKTASVLIIDSITAFWKEFMAAYAKKRKRDRGLEFSDWAYLKTEWGKFTDAYINSALHIVLCGRAGYEWDFFENESGKKELQKTGVKMKAESEMGYEPSLLILMEREIDMDTMIVHRKAHVLKERFGVLDGKSFSNPEFSDFLPHVERLNIGGVQLGVDTKRSSEESIPRSGKTDWQYEREQKEIVLDEIQALIAKHHPGQGAEDKKARIALLEKHFASVSWKRIETFDLATLRAGYNSLLCELEPGITGQFTFADINDRLRGATDVDVLDLAADLIREVSDKAEQQTLSDLYHTLRAELSGK